MRTAHLQVGALRPVHRRVIAVAVQDAGKGAVPPIHMMQGLVTFGVIPIHGLKESFGRIRKSQFHRQTPLTQQRRLDPHRQRVLHRMADGAHAHRLTFKPEAAFQQPLP